MGHLVDLVEWPAAADYVRRPADEGPAVTGMLLDLHAARMMQDDRGGRQAAFVKRVLRGLGSPVPEAEGAPAGASSTPASVPVEPLGT
jgi:hypothetical protein